MKKRIIYIFIIIFIIFSIFISIFFLKKKENNFSETEVSKQFLINQIHCYSSAMSINKSENYHNPEWNLDIYQYTDIAIYIDRIEEVNSTNYIKQLYIDNIKINTPNKRNPKFILFKSY